MDGWVENMEKVMIEDVDGDVVEDKDIDRDRDLDRDLDVDGDVDVDGVSLEGGGERMNGWMVEDVVVYELVGIEIESKKAKAKSWVSILCYCLGFPFCICLWGYL